MRNETGLREAVGLLLGWEQEVSSTGSVHELETVNMLTVGVAIAKAALDRKESRGGHFRSDYPVRLDESWQKHSLQHKEDNDVRYVPVSRAD